MTAIDDWILDRMQIVSDWVHSLVGLNADQQARISAAVCAVCWFTYTLDSARAKSFYWLAGMCLLTSVARVFFSLPDYSTRSAEGVRNIRRIEPLGRFQRIMLGTLVVVVCVMCVIGLATFQVPRLRLQGVVVCRWSWSVLDALDSQTPHASRLRELLSKLLTVAVPIQPSREES